MDEKVIDFAPSGAVSSLHQDTFDLGFLGKQKIERATDIRFDEGHQHWDIHVLGPDGVTWSIPALQGFVQYDQARKFEVQWINACMQDSAEWRTGDYLSRDLAASLRLKSWATGNHE